MKTPPKTAIGLLLAGGLILLTNSALGADPAAGQEKSMVCQGCHGTDGNSLAPQWPNLAAQHASYMQKQLRNFQKGQRVNETMTAMAAGLSEQDIADISAYFAAQKLQPSKTEPEGDVALGRKIYKGGNTYNNVPACAGCHGPNGVGNAPAVFPRLAGQRIEYLEKTLRDFKTDQRSNDPNEIMRNIAVKLSDEEIKAVAAYVATISAPTDK